MGEKMQKAVNHSWSIDGKKEVARDESWEEGREAGKVRDALVEVV